MYLQLEIALKGFGGGDEEFSFVRVDQIQAKVKFVNELTRIWLAMRCINCTECHKKLYYLWVSNFNRVWVVLGHHYAIELCFG